MFKYAALAAYIASIVLANWATNTYGLVSIGFGLMVTAGTFFAGFALVSRDFVQETWSRWVVVGAILVGAGLSAFTSAAAIALASGIAFLASELIDFGVYTPLRKKSLPGAIVASSVVAAPFDTVLFLAIAGFPVTFNAVLGQFLVKTAIALIVAAGFWAAGRREDNDAVSQWV